MTSSIGLKVYLDKGIQTDSPATSILPIGRGSITENDAANNLAVDPSLETSLAHCDTAYIYAETHVSDESISAKPSIPPRQRYAQLHCNRPSNARLPTKRVVSLPEGCTDDLHVDKPSQRVVSMPERLKPESPDTSGSFSSLDIGSVSFESNTLDLTKNPGIQTYPYSLPSTPSPPSSPESILIIGSNSQVPRTLFRSNAAYKQAYSDNGGWISWANSPPRPIPALHGPLSLPYARCPSGAEGTIIEGEDLANMIWGLNVEETRSHGSTNTGLRNQNAPPRLQKSPKSSSCALPNDGAIDLSQLAVLRPNSSETMTGQICVANQGANIIHGRRQHALGTGRTRLQDMAATGFLNWNRGLGLNWQDPIELPPPQNVLYQDVDHSTLKASAPPFIPSNPSIPRGLTRIVVESRLPDAMQNINQGQGHNSMPYLPTPPNTSSPLWSPYVATPPEMDMMSPQISLHGLPESKQLLLSQLFSPRIALKDYTQDYHWVAEQLESVAKLKITPPGGVLKVLPSIDIVNLDNLDEGKRLSPNRDLNKATVNLVSDLAPHRVQQQCNGRNVSASPEGRFRGISQQPRSIPLARLIQRRLSSVAEEDVNALTEESDALPATTRAYTVTVSGNIQSTTPTQFLGSSDQAMKRTPSPDTGKLEPRTSQEPDQVPPAAPKTKKAVVKLPGSDASSKDAPNGGKEKHTTIPTGTVKKKPRNRRNRSSSIEGANSSMTVACKYVL